MVWLEDVQKLVLFSALRNAAFVIDVETAETVIIDVPMPVEVADAPALQRANTIQRVPVVMAGLPDGRSVLTHHVGGSALLGWQKQARWLII